MLSYVRTHTNKHADIFCTPQSEENTNQLSGGQVVEPLKQLNARGLAAARRSHQRHLLAGIDGDGEVPEDANLLARGVAELSVTELDVAVNTRLTERGEGHHYHVTHTDVAVLIQGVSILGEQPF